MFLIVSNYAGRNFYLTDEVGDSGRPELAGLRPDESSARRFATQAEARAIIKKRAVAYREAGKSLNPMKVVRATGSPSDYVDTGTLPPGTVH